MDVCRPLLAYADSGIETLDYSHGSDHFDMLIAQTLYSFILSLGAAANTTEYNTVNLHGTCQAEVSEREGDRATCLIRTLP
jgi:hypothetical protein